MMGETGHFSDEDEVKVLNEVLREGEITLSELNRRLHEGMNPETADIVLRNLLNLGFIRIIRDDTLTAGDAE